MQPLAAKVGDADAYRGADVAGTPHFPGFGAEATEWLLRRRGIRSLGVDTLSIDLSSASSPTSRAPAARPHLRLPALGG